MSNILVKKGEIVIRRSCICLMSLLPFISTEIKTTTKMRYASELRRKISISALSYLSLSFSSLSLLRTDWLSISFTLPVSLFLFLNLLHLLFPVAPIESNKRQLSRRSFQQYQYATGTRINFQWQRSQMACCMQCIVSDTRQYLKHRYTHNIAGF